MRRLTTVLVSAIALFLIVLPAAADPITPPPGVYTWPGSVLLAVSTSPSGAGSVTTADAYIACPNECIKPFDVGQTITLTAHETSGFTFIGWSGDACAGQGNPCTFTIAADTSVTANFTGQYAPPLGPYILTVVGPINSRPVGVQCNAGGVCSAEFAAGTQVILRVHGAPCRMKAEDGTFHQSPYTISMDRSRYIVAECDVQEEG